MKKTLLLIPILMLFQVVTAQSVEHYLQISINSRADLDFLTQIVSIDNVQGNTVIAYANENEYAMLKKSGYQFQSLPHPSSDPSKVINMATTVEQMQNWDRYPTYEVYVQMMQNWAANYPNLCKLDTIGYSVQNRLLLALKISDNPMQDEAEPQLLYTSTIHGDETTGMILMMRLIDYLLVNYGSIERVTNIVNNMEVYISPNTNPDGTYYSGNHTVSGSRRANANGQDLNRDFPGPTGPNAPYQPETQLMMDYATAHHFILGANFHGGIEVVNYPWDSYTSSQNTHADHAWYGVISRQYATLAQQNSPSGYMTGQNNGVTHGGDWYVIYGGRQDYMNYFHSCREITLEVSNTKLLSTDQLVAHWNYNREAILTHIELAHYGIRGLVTNTNGEPLNATMTIIGYDKDKSHVMTNPAHGNYYRMLLPGSYNLKFESYGYIPQTINNVTVSQNNATQLDVVLQQAEVVPFNGIVVSSATGRPLDGVTVAIQGIPVGSDVTGEQGEFQVNGIMEGEYFVKFSKVGYVSKTEFFQIVQGMEEAFIVLDAFSGFSFEDGIIPEGFDFSGNLPWAVDTGEAYDGEKSMKSGAISHNQSSTMTYTFTCQSSGDVTFYVKVSSEVNYDKLQFWIDGTLKDTWSGNVGWTECIYQVASGSHTLKWTYSKDGSVSGGSDAAWVDFISIPSIQNLGPVAYISPRPVVVETYDETSSLDLFIRNVGQGTLYYEMSAETIGSSGWLTLEDPTGGLEANEQSMVTMYFNFSGMDHTQYNANILVDVMDSIITVPVIVDYLVGIGETNTSQIAVYPNPANNQVVLSVKELTDNTRLTIYSISGVKLYETKLNSEKTTFDLNSVGIVSEGVYLLQVKTAKDTQQIKLVVQ